jgi:putative Holliday junction resolvase
MSFSRILALDVGHKRIGVAVSDPMRITAQGLTTLQRRDIESDVETIRRLVKHHQVAIIVVGMPLRLDGSRGPEAVAVEEFIKALAVVVDCPIKPWDERLTTVQAEQVLIEGGVRRQKRKGLRDQVAATLLLQNYLDSIRKKASD